MEDVPHAQDDIGVRPPLHVVHDVLARQRKLDHLGAVVDLVSEPVRRLVDVDRPGELEVGRELDRVPGCQVEPRHAFARADLHGRQEAAEVVLDPREVHLVEDHVELARHAARLVARVPLARRVGDELTERRVVVKAVEGGEVAEQVVGRANHAVEARFGQPEIGEECFRIVCRQLRDLELDARAERYGFRGITNGVIPTGDYTEDGRSVFEGT